MCEDLQCSLHMSVESHDVFKWWITEGLDRQVSYGSESLLKVDVEFGNIADRSALIDVIYVTDLSLFTES